MSLKVFHIKSFLLFPRKGMKTGYCKCLCAEPRVQGHFCPQAFEVHEAPFHHTPSPHTGHVHHTPSPQSGHTCCETTQRCSSQQYTLSTQLKLHQRFQGQTVFAHVVHMHKHGHTDTDEHVSRHLQRQPFQLHFKEKHLETPTDCKTNLLRIEQEHIQGHAY